jgi:FlaG/FlaF family flagellin (archaellin)
MDPARSLAILGLMGGVTTVFFGIIGTVGETRDRTSGRLTRYGRLAVVGILAGAFISQMSDYFKREEEARAAKAQAQRYEGIIKQTNRIIVQSATIRSETELNLEKTKLAADAATAGASHTIALQGQAKTILTQVSYNANLTKGTLAHTLKIGTGVQEIIGNGTKTLNRMSVVLNETDRGLFSLGDVRAAYAVRISLDNNRDFAAIKNSLNAVAASWVGPESNAALLKRSAALVIGNRGNATALTVFLPSPLLPSTVKLISLWVGAYRKPIDSRSGSLLKFGMSNNADWSISLEAPPIPAAPWSIIPTSDRKTFVVICPIPIHQCVMDNYGSFDGGTGEAPTFINASSSSVIGLSDVLGGTLVIGLENKFIDPANPGMPVLDNVTLIISGHRLRITARNAHVLYRNHSGAVFYAVPIPSTVEKLLTLLQ